MACRPGMWQQGCQAAQLQRQCLRKMQLPNCCVQEAAARPCRTLGVIPCVVLLHSAAAAVLQNICQALQIRPDAQLKAKLCEAAQVSQPRAVLFLL